MIKFIMPDDDDFHWAEAQKRIKELEAENRELQTYKLGFQSADERALELEAERDKLKEGLEDLTDRLKNGIEYDEENNQYLLVWTERELEQAGREAEELMKFFNAKLREGEG